MLTEDYLMRLINMAVAALVRAVGLRKAGKHEDAHQAVDGALEQLLGMQSTLLERLGDDSLVGALLVQDNVDPQRAALVGDLFLEKAALLSEQQRTSEAQQAAGRALRFLLEAALSTAFDPVKDLADKIRAAEQASGTAALPVVTLSMLADFYEQTGLYRDAERPLARLLAEPGMAGDLLPEQAAYYRRLLEQSDAALAAGGVSREWALARLEETLK